MAELGLMLESFERNGRVNRALLASLEMADLVHDDGAGGWNIGQLLAEMAEFRYGWLSRISPEHATSIPSVADGNQSEFWLTAKSIEELQQAFDAGDAAVREAVMSAANDGRKFEGAYESHPAHFMQHVIVHDSHHRGQILAVLRKAGRSAEERAQLEEDTWPIWRQ